MPFTVEFDDKETKYRSVIIRLSGGIGHRCWYVSVPADHPFYGQSYYHKIDFDCNSAAINPTDPIGTMLAAHEASKDPTKMEISYAANIHGGITYANGKGNYPVESENLWWFGFDAGHAGDDHDGGQSLDYMKAECEKLKAFLQSHENKEKVAA
jgi:hypothetical protein